MAHAKIWLYALPALPMALPTLPLFILLPSFYHTHFGLSLPLIGGVLFAARLVDVASDFLAAAWCDRALGRLGRRHGWIVIGGLITAPGLVMVFHPAANAGGAWLFFAYSLTSLGWTLIQVPYQAWIQVLSPVEAVRVHYAAAREAAGIVGLLFSAALPALLLGLGYSEKQSFSLLTWGTIALGFFSFALIFRLPRDFSQPDIQQPTPPLLTLQYWRPLLSNRLFLKVNAAWAFNGLANGSATVLFPFVITVGFQGTSQDRAVFLLAYFLAAMLALPLIKPLCRYVPRHRLWIANMLLAILIFIPIPLLTLDDKMLFLGVCILTGLCLAADLVLPPTLQADLADQDQSVTGQDRPSVFFATQSLITKLSLGISAVLALTLVGMSNPLLPDTSLAPENATATIDRTRLLVTYSWLPVIFKILACACLWSYPSNAKLATNVQVG